MADTPFLKLFQKLLADFVLFFIQFLLSKFGIAAALSLLKTFLFFHFTPLTVRPIIRGLLLRSFTTIYEC